MKINGMRWIHFICLLRLIHFAVCCPFTQLLGIPCRLVGYLNVSTRETRTTVDQNHKGYIFYKSFIYPFVFWLTGELLLSLCSILTFPAAPFPIIMCFLSICTHPSSSAFVHSSTLVDKEKSNAVIPNQGYLWNQSSAYLLNLTKLNQ